MEKRDEISASTSELVRSHESYTLFLIRTSKFWPRLVVHTLSISLKKDKRYNLRSCAMGIMLQTPRTLTKKTLGDRAFLAAAPKLWNGLPSQIRNEPNFNRFKGLLKTHLFKLTFY